MKIKVLRKHIENGEKMDEGFCPVALALKSRGYEGVCVNEKTITLRKGKYRNIYELNTPPVAKNFIRSFDSGKQVRPFTFILE